MNVCNTSDLNEKYLDTSKIFILDFYFFILLTAFKNIFVLFYYERVYTSTKGQKIRFLKIHVIMAKCLLFVFPS